MIPKVAINFALSLDGKIATRGNSPALFTSPADKSRFVKIREQSDAILVGRTTQETDNMSMVVPDTDLSRQPLRCIASKSGSFNFDSKVFQTSGGLIHLIVDSETRISIPDKFRNSVVVHHASVKDFILTKSAKLGIKHVLCEGGGKLAKELFAEDLVDTIYLTWAGHSLFGGSAAPTITGLTGDFLASSKHYKLVHFEPHSSGECFLTYTRA